MRHPTPLHPSPEETRITLPDGTTYTRVLIPSTDPEVRLRWQEAVELLLSYADSAREETAACPASVKKSG